MWQYREEVLFLLAGHSAASRRPGGLPAPEADRARRQDTKSGITFSRNGEREIMNDRKQMESALTRIVVPELRNRWYV